MHWFGGVRHAIAKYTMPFLHFAFVLAQNINLGVSFLILGVKSHQLVSKREASVEGGGCTHAMQ